MPNLSIKMVNNPSLSNTPNKYVFHVPPKTTKHEIREHLSKLYGFDIIKMSTVNYDGKVVKQQVKKSQRYYQGKAYKRVECVIATELLENPWLPRVREPKPERFTYKQPRKQQQPWLTLLEKLEAKRAWHVEANRRAKVIFDEKQAVAIARQQQKIENRKLRMAKELEKDANAAADQRARKAKKASDRAAKLALRETEAKKVAKAKARSLASDAQDEFAPDVEQMKIDHGLAPKPEGGAGEASGEGESNK
jgi:ribosomal protein L23